MPEKVVFANTEIEIDMTLLLTNIYVVLSLRRKSGLHKQFRWPQIRLFCRFVCCLANNLSRRGVAGCISCRPAMTAFHVNQRPRWKLTICGRAFVAKFARFTCDFQEHFFVKASPPTCVHGHSLKTLWTFAYDVSRSIWQRKENTWDFLF